MTAIDEVKQRFSRISIDLTEEQATELIALDRQYADIGFPGLAYNVAQLLSKEQAEAIKGIAIKLS